MAGQELFEDFDYLRATGWSRFGVGRPRTSSIVEELGLLLPFDLCTKTDSHETAHAAQENLLVGGIPFNVKRAIVTAE